VSKKSEWTYSHERPDQVVSALRKAIRRGEVDNALHWLVELILSGEAWWAWRQLVIATSEECGPGWPEGPATIQALYSAWRMTSDPLHAVDANIRLCRAPKSRIADDALAAHLMGHQREMARPIPDEALDVHTVSGRYKLGRTEDSEVGQQHWWDEAAKLVGEVPDPEADHYKELVKRWWAENRSYPEARRPEEYQKPPKKDYQLPLGGGAPGRPREGAWDSQWRRLDGEHGVVVVRLPGVRPLATLQAHHRREGDGEDWWLRARRLPSQTGAVCPKSPFAAHPQEPASPSPPTQASTTQASTTTTSSMCPTDQLSRSKKEEPCLYLTNALRHQASTS
jgi:hypothetical protein